MEEGGVDVEEEVEVDEEEVAEEVEEEEDVATTAITVGAEATTAATKAINQRMEVDRN